MERRTFLGGSAAILAAPLHSIQALADEPTKLPVIGFLSSSSPDPSAENVAAFRQGLSETGYVEGQDLAIEYRWAEFQYDRLPALAADLVARKVEVIATNGDPRAALAAKNATSTIPIVFSAISDPVSFDLVASLARPGGNLTGVSPMVTELMPKRLELLSELVPQAGVIALLANPSNSSAERRIRDVRKRRARRGCSSLS